MTNPTPGDWSERWQGGFCAVGALEGLPVRGRDVVNKPPLSDCLILPPHTPLPVRPLDHALIEAELAAALGGRTLLAPSVAAARAALLESLDVAPGEPVGLPANASRPLVEVVKSRGARPLFLGLDERLALVPPRDEPRVIWAQPTGGLIDPATAAYVPVTQAWRGGTLVVDYADTLPALGTNENTEAESRCDAAVELWGLHLDEDKARAGALVRVPPGREELAERIARLLARERPEPRVDGLPRRAAAQLGRLAALSAQQRTMLDQARRGVEEAAGLVTLPLSQCALGHGVAVHLPAETDPATFYAYVRGENTPIEWLATMRPIHYAALREGDAHWRSSATALASWLLVPVGPEQTTDEIRLAVLGVVKAADYLGVRWRTDPDRARAYAREMDERYGRDHDAYRPVFLNGARSASLLPLGEVRPEDNRR